MFRAALSLERRAEAEKVSGGELMPTVKEMVENFLKSNGYNGLVHGSYDCACGLEDLMFCDDLGDGNCIAGYKAPCDCGEHDFHIVENNPTSNHKCPLNWQKQNGTGL